MGRHINQINYRLEKIEECINEINSDHKSFVKENATEITNIKENMVNKQEFSDFIDKMKTSMGEMLPPLPFLKRETTLVEESQSEAIMQ
ncbi:MAG: hypothetical protein V1915_00125 [Candidatus Bathyarchaeota archaeon]